MGIHYRSPTVIIFTVHVLANSLEPGETPSNTADVSPGIQTYFQKWQMYVVNKIILVDAIRYSYGPEHSGKMSI